jgi:hypothetical protein
MKRPLSSERRRIIQRPVLTHNQWRLLQRYAMDPERAMLANCAIGNASWCTPFAGIFGDLNAALYYLPCRAAQILRFPERRSSLAKLRAEIEEMRKTVRGGCC